uniref:Uncharacterized protein n=1 Tax=Cacopsylla melanoneura TaxID=428564 RepID=A0A8D8T6S1_9HEMI
MMLEQENFRFRFPVSYFPGSQGRWVPKADLQPQEAESISRPEEVPFDEPPPPSRFSSEGRLPGKNRSLPGVLPCTNKTLSPEIPLSGVPRQYLLYDMSTIWSGFGSTNLCETDQLGGRLLAQSRSESGSLPGRFPVSEPGLGMSSGSSPGSSSNSPAPWLDGQLREIPAISDSVLPIPGHSLESEHRFEVSSSGEANGYSQISSVCPSIPSLVLENSKGNHGISELRRICYSFRKTSLPPDSMGESSSFQKSAAQTGCYTKISPVPNSVVDFCPPSIVTHFPAVPSGICNIGRLRCGLGSSGKRPDAQRFLDGCSERMAHQLEGVVCRSKGSGVECSASSEQSCSCTIRQSYRDCVHSQGRGNQIPQAPPGSRSSLQCSGHSQYGFDCQVHPRKVQHMGGQPFSTKMSSRLASVTGSNFGNISSLGRSRDRPICDGQFCSCSSIRSALGSGSSGAVRRRLFSNVELCPSLDFPASSASTSCPQPSEFRAGAIYPDSSLLGERVLAAGSRGKSSSSSHVCEEIEGESDRPVLGSSSPRSELSEFAGPAGSGWLFQVSGWEQSDLNLLRSAWRKSTLNSYKAPWKRWLNWTASSNVSVNNPSPQDLSPCSTFFLQHNFSSQVRSIQLCGPI